MEVPVVVVERAYVEMQQDGMYEMGEMTMRAAIRVGGWIAANKIAAAAVADTGKMGEWELYWVDAGCVHEEMEVEDYVE